MFYFVALTRFKRRHRLVSDGVKWRDVLHSSSGDVLSLKAGIWGELSW